MKKITVGAIVLFLGLVVFLICTLLNSYLSVAGVLIFIVGVYLLLGLQNLYMWAISLFFLGLFVIEKIPALVNVSCYVPINGTNGIYTLLPVYPPVICIAASGISILAVTVSIIILVIGIALSIARRTKKN